MALRADREVVATELRYFLNETAEKGVILSVSTAGSGVGLDNTKNVATVAASSSGNKPLGVLLNTFVNIDQSRFPINWHKDEANQGDKAAILTKGWVVTNKITGTATAGDKAVLSSSGYVAVKAVPGSYNEVANPIVGRFRTGSDENGYATLLVDL